MTGQVLNISKIASYITGTAAAIGVLWGIFRFVETTKKSNNAIQEITVKVDSLYRRFDNVSTNSYRLDKSINELQIDIVNLRGAIDRTQKSYARYLIHDNTLTKEEFYKYMDGLTIENVKVKDSLDLKIKIRKK